MKIKLDDIDLIVRWTAGLPCVCSVQRISVNNHLKIIEGRRLGIEGSSMANAKRRTMRMLLEGSLYGIGFADVLAQIRSKYKEGNPIPFSSNLTLLSKVDKVIIEELMIFLVSSLPHSCFYRMLLVEESSASSNGSKSNPPPSQNHLSQSEISSAVDDAARGMS